MKRLLIALGIAASSSPALADAQVDGCRIIQAGIYAADNGSSAYRDANGVLIHTDTTLPKLALSTTNIPVKAGASFGFEYVLTGSPDGAAVTVRDETHYPGQGGKPPGATEPLKVAPTDDKASINRGFFTVYTLEEPWELLPGKWEFQIWLGDRELCSQVFTLTAE